MVGPSAVDTLGSSERCLELQLVNLCVCVGRGTQCHGILRPRGFPPSAPVLTTKHFSRGREKVDLLATPKYWNSEQAKPISALLCSSEFHLCHTVLLMQSLKGSLLVTWDLLLLRTSPVADILVWPLHQLIFVAMTDQVNGL